MNKIIIKQLMMSTASRPLPILQLDESPAPGEVALLSEDALAEDWNRKEENEAWRHLDAIKG